jgi:uncharacterized protein DUF5995
LNQQRASLIDVFEPRAKSTAEVLETMRLIEASLPTLDGVAWFNKMYRRVTEHVRGALSEGSFSYPKFMEALTVSFANLYFQALYNSLHDPSRVPKAWAPLFDARLSRKIAPIQFALAGLNAHINRDLSVALVSTCKKMRATPDDKRRRDFDLVTGILEETLDEVKEWFATGFLAYLDVSFGRVDDVIAIFSIRTARDTAWMSGQAFWELRSIPSVALVQLANIDRLVGLAGRGLLTPTAL